MKKSFIFAMAMALGITVSAHAANPFSDVPVRHWAYGSIKKLVAAGVIEGYGDGTFGGKKLITRYEMAQMVARAMANGANVDKLAAEFADELDALGVRVANIEKNADAVKITGLARFHYNSFHGHHTNGKRTASWSRLRSRLFFKGQVNDDWTYTGMIDNEQDLAHSYTGDEDTWFERAYVNGRLGGLDVEAGRNQQHWFGTHGQVYGDRADFIKFSYGKDIKLIGMYGKLANPRMSGIDPRGEEFWRAYIRAKIGAAYASLSYVDVKNQRTAAMENGCHDNSILGAVVWVPVVKHLTFEGVWLKASEDDRDGHDQGIIGMLKYKGAKANRPGSWGAFARYYNMAGSTIIVNGEDNSFENRFLRNGFSGYAVGAEYTVAKNIMAFIDWTELEGKKNGDEDGGSLWTHLTFFF